MAAAPLWGSAPLYLRHIKINIFKILFIFVKTLEVLGKLGKAFLKSLRTIQSFGLRTVREREKILRAVRRSGLLF